MIIVHVFIHAKPNMIGAFKEANVKNARSSSREPGILRFDVMQEEDDPTRFLLVEIYKDDKAIAQHKQTPHYAEWLEFAEPMLAEPRTKIIYKNIFPDDKEF